MPCGKGEGRPEGFPDFLSQKEEVSIQNDTNPGSARATLQVQCNYRNVLLPKVVGRFKRFELYRVWRVHTQAMWSQPETTRSFSIAVAANALNIQELEIKHS